MLIPSPWRADFPAIAALQRQGQTYLDNAATTQKPQALLDALAHYYANGAANVHRAQHLPGAQYVGQLAHRQQACTRADPFGSDVEIDQPIGIQRQHHQRQRATFGQLLPCLLYTSPSPRDATLSRMPSSA